jgi:hypothetical protein
MEMTELDDAMQEHMAYLVFVEHTTFSYLDFLSFEVNGVEYKMSHGTFRNKISKLISIDKVELVCNSGLGFYSLKGIQVQKKKLMTPNHMGVYSCHCCHYHQQENNRADDVDTAIASSLPSIYSLIQDLPLDKNSLHDIRLRFEIPDIYTIFSSSLKVSNIQQQQQLQLNSDSMDISLPTWNINGLNIKTTVHRTNTVSVIVGCSYIPIATDVGGVIRLTNALSKVEERLSRLVDECGNAIPGGYESLPIPEHNKWMVTMWHFGADASIEYTGEKFSATWNVGKNALIRAYSKVMKDGKARIRLERQEYPRKTFADAIEEKLQFNDTGGGGSNAY